MQPSAMDQDVFALEPDRAQRWHLAPSAIEPALCALTVVDSELAMLDECGESR